MVSFVKTLAGQRDVNFFQPYEFMAFCSGFAANAHQAYLHVSAVSAPAQVVSDQLCSVLSQQT